MKIRNVNLIIIVGFAVFAVGCTWVKQSDQAQNVRVLSADQVENCKKVARTTVTVLGSVLGVERKKEKVQLELETKARNAAPEYGGNVVVSTSEIEDGKQSFNIYDCPG